MNTKLFFLLLSISSFAQIPQYYDGVNFSVNSEEIKSQLATLISTTHTTQLVYTSGSSGLLDTWTVLKESDIDTANPSNVLLIYGWDNTTATLSEDRSRGVNLSCHTSSCTGKWVREHTFPKSLGTPNLGTESAGADAHNLRAIDSQRNNSRSNKVFGGAPASNASFSIDAYSWYPGDEWIGDVARIVMYMYLRYPEQCSAKDVASSGSTFAPLEDMPDILLHWNAQDPPSAFELHRNNVIAAAQGNRNPFIDNPYLAFRIWNGPEAIDSWNVLKTQSYITPKFLLFPTYTKGVTYIQSNTSDTYRIEVFNTFGQLISSINTTDLLDLSEHANGLYFVQIQTDNYQKTFKIVKH